MNCVFLSHIPLSSCVAFIDHEVPASCVEMNTYAQFADYPDIPSLGAACYNLGGQYFYGREANYKGTCSDHVPCNTISSSDVTVYQFTC